eukprot:3637248-Amphidinium_carterae.1
MPLRMLSQHAGQCSCKLHGQRTGRVISDTFKNAHKSACESKGKSAHAKEHISEPAGLQLHG